MSDAAAEKDASSAVKTCSIDGCGKPMKARGWCNAHWGAWKRYGDPLKRVAPPPLPDYCEAPGCEVSARSRWKGGVALCAKHYLRMLNGGSLDARERPTPPPDGLCTVEGCGSTANRIGAGMCEKHYIRNRRRAAVQSDLPLQYKRTTLKPGLLKHTGGYLLDHAPGHPLQRQSNRVYQHRIVYHAIHGDGPFNCNWCQKVVTWDDMHVDHLDDDPTNNDSSNLVASCPPCNQARGRWKLVAINRQKYGKEFNGKVRTLGEWSSELGVPRSRLAQRLAAGWSLERALTEARGRSGPTPKRARPRG